MSGLELDRAVLERRLHKCNAICRRSTDSQGQASSKGGSHVQEPELQPFMRRGESQALIKTQGVSPGFVAGQLHKPAIAPPGLLDCPSNHPTTDATGTELTGYPHAFYLATPAALVADARQKRQLHGSRDTAVLHGDYQLVVRIGRDGFEGAQVG